jgi:S-adenosylmethionine synthetase
MSLEAAAGKNPVSHVGKLYNVLATEIARTVCAEVPEVSEASVQLVSRIGQFVSEPWVALVEVVSTGRLTKALRQRVEKVVASHLGSVDYLTSELIAGRARVY